MKPLYASLAFLSLILVPFAGAQDSTAVRTDAAPPLEIGFDAEVGLLGFENADGDRESFLSTVLMPTFRQGLWAAGARVKMRLNGSGIRKEDYDDFADILSIARFVQYSFRPEDDQRSTGYFGRLGELEGIRLGYGQLIGEYRNTVSVDNPKIGIEGSRGMEKMFVQGVFSSVTSPGVFGARGAYWPLTDREDQFKNAVFGVSLAGDLDNDGQLVNERAPGIPYVAAGDVGNGLIGVVEGSEDGALVMASIDAGLPIQIKQLDDLLAYTEVAKIFGYGSGLSVGLNGSKQQGDWRLEGWVEQRLIGKQYLPNYFNSLYEVERLQRASVDLGDGTSIPAFTSKRNILAGQDETLLGSFVAFEARVRRKYRVRTSYEQIWNKADAGWFHIDVRVTDATLPYQVRFMFDRINVGQMEDIWAGPSKNGIMRIELAYAFWDKLLLGFRFRQSFEPVERLGRLVGQDKQTRIEPNFVIRL